MNSDGLCIECFGTCKLSIHLRCLPGATTESVEALTQLKNAVFVCDACLVSREHGEKHSEKLLRELLAKMKDFECVIDLAKNFEKSVKKIVSEELRVNNKVGAASAGNKTETSGVQTRAAAKKRKLEGVENPPVDNETPKSSYASAVKARPKITEQEQKQKQERKPAPVVIVMPKEGVQVENARSEIQKKVDARNLNVKRVTESRDGAVVIELRDEASVKVLEEKVKEQLGGRFEMKVRDSMKPTIKIIGMSDEYDEAELQSTLVDQNETFANLKHFKLRKTFCNENWRYDNHSAIVELDAETFFKVMAAGKVNCGWNRCRVFDGLAVTRCFKCCGYNHKIADCKSEVWRCPICSDNHPVQECQSKIVKCANCEKARIERRLPIDVDHTAWDSHCQAYIEQHRKRSRMVDFTA